MNPEVAQQMTAVLAEAKARLRALSASSEKEIASMTASFRTLAIEANKNLALAASVVKCVDSESVGSVFARVQSLCATVRELLGLRLDAVSQILGALKTVGNRLGQLAGVTRRQEAVALQFKALSVLTRVEVQSLGSVGEGFQHLANELSEFAANVARETQELAGMMEDRRHSIEETKEIFAAGLPGLRKEMARIENDVGQAVEAISARLAQLAKIPETFRTCVEQTARQIDGVVAAVQGHDITRQQIEHVEEALDLIVSRISRPRDAQAAAGEGWSLTSAGLTIQIGQLKNIQDTVGTWTSQIGSCVSDIQRLSASEMAGIGSVVLEQERDLSAQIAGIEQLQQASQAHSQTVEDTLGGLSSLLEIVNDHLRRSERIRDGLHLLTLNSIIEARRMGQRGVVVSSLANLINVSSEDWNAITEESKQVETEIMDLVRQTDRLMEAFSEASSEKLRQDQRQTKATLEDVRKTAAFVDKQASEMHTITQEMQATAADVHRTQELLLASFAGLAAALSGVQGVSRDLAAAAPQVSGDQDVEQAEQLFSSCYTTEIERQILRAALNGTAMPVPQQTFEGNSVELF